MPPYDSISYNDERTFKLLGPLGEAPNVWAECLAIDPVSDIAVLSSPDPQAFPKEACAYEEFVGSTERLVIGDAPKVSSAWLLSLDGHWFECEVLHFTGPIWIMLAKHPIEGGMSGSPILSNCGRAIGVLSTTACPTAMQTGGGPNAALVDNLPGWLLRELGVLRFASTPECAADHQ
jgi:hypothetical protein